MGRDKDLDIYDNAEDQEDDMDEDLPEEEPDYEVDDYVGRDNLNDLPAEYWDE